MKRSERDMSLMVKARSKMCVSAFTDVEGNISILEEEKAVGQRAKDG